MSLTNSKSYVPLNDSHNNGRLTRWLKIAIILLTEAAMISAGVAFILLFIAPRWFGSESYPDPPPYQNYPAMARYVVHRSNWAAISTFSTHSGIESYPFNNIVSLSDGVVCNSTGVPYFYITDMDLSGKDLLHDNRTTLAVSLAESTYCSNLKYDPEDPRCARVILTGVREKLPPNTPEYEAAMQAVFPRHPSMKDWPTDHDWYFARLNIERIYLLDYFGGATIITAKEYYAATPPQPPCL